MDEEPGNTQGNGGTSNYKEPLLIEQLELSDDLVRSESDVDIFPATSDEQYVLAINIGTSTIKGQVFDSYSHLRGTAAMQLKLLHPEPAWCEIDPDRLVKDVCRVALECIRVSGLRPDQITCMGLATDRASFLTWDRETGQPFHNIITRQDLRAAEYVGEWNKSYKLFSYNTAAKLLYKILGKKRHMEASVLKFSSNQVTLKLLWVLENIPEVRLRAAVRQVMFGCTETWLLWKMTLGKSHLTDYSCASATGLFDLFQMEWSNKVCSLVNIPRKMFPKVRDTSGDFGITDPDVCGFRIPITAVVANQQGSMFGHCCFSPGDVRCTLGTGTFMHLHTGSEPHASTSDLYPLIGWKIGSEVVYLAEGQSADAGVTLEWARSLGLVTDILDSSQIAESVPDSGGVFFVPTFSGLQAPHNDDKAAVVMLGMTPNTSKAQLVRAMLDSVVFRFKSLYETAMAETRLQHSVVRVDGDASGNTFLVQMMSDAFNKVIECSQGRDMSCLGAAYLAGLARGVWSSKEVLKKLRPRGRQVQPRATWSTVRTHYSHWQNAVHRSKRWYPTT